MSYNVGDKFIVEIGQIYYNHEGVPYPLYKMKGFNSLVFDEHGLNKLEKFKEEHEPILTDWEHEYLQALIKPCKESIRTIIKSDFDGNNECIQVCLPTVSCYLLPFTDGEMYRGMEKGRPYTLEELGL